MGEYHLRAANRAHEMKPLRTHYPLLALAALFACAKAPAAELNEAEKRTVALVVDFCGSFVGEEPPSVDAAAARAPGLNVGPTIRIETISRDENVRRSFREFFHSDDAAELRFAGFSATPSRNERPYAAFKPDGESCMVVLTPGSRAVHEAIELRLAQSGGRWTRDGKTTAAGQLPTWRREADFGEKVFVTGQTDAQASILVVTIEQRPVPSPVEIRTITHAAITPCVAGVLADKPAGPAEFGSYFHEMTRRKDGEIDILTLRSVIAGPRAFLEVIAVPPVSKCQLFLKHPDMPVETMSEHVLAAVKSLPGIKDVMQPARGDKAARQAWRWTRPGQRQPVDFRIVVNDEYDFVVLDIAWADR
jgi:hypothetical protein